MDPFTVFFVGFVGVLWTGATVADKHVVRRRVGLGGRR
jgi:hypothetical protein